LLGLFKKKIYPTHIHYFPWNTRHIEPWSNFNWRTTQLICVWKIACCFEGILQIQWIHHVLGIQVSTSRKVNHGSQSVMTLPFNTLLATNV
jgi:hypothetical protein